LRKVSRRKLLERDIIAELHNRGRKLDVRECMGHKSCPKAPNNEKRFLCPFYQTCIDMYILAELNRGSGPIEVLQNLTEILNDSEGYGISNFQLLGWIGRVASANGFHFGRKKVDRAIRESLANDEFSGHLEAHEIRRAFGVYGVEGMRRAKKVPIGQIPEPRIDLGSEFVTQAILGMATREDPLYIANIGLIICPILGRYKRVS